MAEGVTFPSGIPSLLLGSANLPVRAFLDLFPHFRPHPKWTFSQALQVRIVRLFLQLSYTLNLRPSFTLLPGKEAGRWEVIHLPTLSDPSFLTNLSKLGVRLPSTITSDHTLQSALYSAPLDDAVVKPEPVGATWFPELPPQDCPIPPNADVVLHFHGGAWVIGDGRDHDAGFLARGLLRNTGVKYVVSPQYRLASYPQGRFPAALQDAITCYLHLIGNLGIRPERITLSGDSAGGNMVLGVLRFLLTDEARKLNFPQPGCAWLWSPWVDVGIAADPAAARMSPHLATDYITPLFGYWGALSVSSPSKGDPDAAGSVTGPYLSPLRHPFHTPVPILLHTGSHEVLYHCLIDFYRRFTTGPYAKTPQDDPVHFGLRDHVPDSPPIDFFDGMAGPIPKDGARNNIKLVVSDGAPHDIALIGHVLGYREEFYRCAALAGRFLLENRYVSPQLQKKDSS